jgi:protocadherin delta 1
MVTVVSLDREQENKTSVTVQCEDMGDTSLSSAVAIPVYIKDQNDHAPMFTKPIYRASVPENSVIGYSILTVRATDKDVGPNAQIAYYLHANSNNLFKIGSGSGIVTTNSILDHERITNMEFYILAIDQGDQTFTATATVSLTITDINDEPPTFRQNSYNFGTYENQLPGTKIGTVMARDKDSPPNDKFRFSIRDTTAFSIDSEIGTITTKKLLDREHQAAYYLAVVATDVQPPHLSGTVTVTIYVTDKNDNAPTIDYPNSTNQTIEVSGFAPQGFIVTRVKAHDADQGDHAKLTYSIAKGNEAHLFKIDPDRGIISVATDLSQVTKDIHNLMIIVQDHGEDFNSAVTSLIIQINRTQAFADNLEMSFINTGTESASGVTDAATGRFRSQDVILIILGAITIVLVSILVTAIVCIKKRQRHRDRDSYKYMCRIDLANQLSALQHDRPDGDQDSRRHSDGSLNDELEKGHFTHFDPRDSGIQAPSLSGSFSDISNGSHVALQASYLCITLHMNISVYFHTLLIGSSLIIISTNTGVTHTNTRIKST